MELELEPALLGRPRGAYKGPKRGTRVAKPVESKTAQCLAVTDLAVTGLAMPAHDAPAGTLPRFHPHSTPHHSTPHNSTRRDLPNKAVWQRFRAAVLPAVAALALGGCVAAPVSDTLESAALTSPDTAVETGETALLADGTSLGDTPFASVLATVPVPTRSPSAQSGGELALLSEETAPVINPAAAPAAQGDLETAALATGGTAEQPAAAAGENESTETVAGSATPTQEVASAEPLRQPKVQQPKKAGGLFGLFMASRQTKPKKIVEPKQPAMASASGYSSSGGLPGVQRKGAIFGIAGSEENDEEPGIAAEQNIQVASVGGIGRLISPSGLILQTDKVEVGCFKPDLLAILKKVERRYGKKVMVTSGYRSPQRNRRAGGVSNSTHIYCKAADIQVEGISKWDLAKYLRSIDGRGGVGTYCRTNSVHIDVGSQRDWHHPCRRSGSRSKKKKA